VRHAEPLQLPLTGPVYLFGQVRSPDGSAPSPDSKLVGSTGLGCNVPLTSRVELLFGCGPELTYLGAARGGRAPDHPTLPWQPQLFRLDVQCRCPLWGAWGLECQGAACPAFNAWERDQLNQDVRLVCPMGKGGQLQLGAKHFWQASGEPKPGTEGMQLYGGFRLGW
jgi:hypothetical protein